MLQIRKRWPILTALIAAAAYGANHYQIGGLEHVRIEPRQGTAVEAGRIPNDLAAFESPGGMLPWGLEGASSTAPAWNSSLSLGEKLTLWQDKLQGMSKGATSSAGETWPSPLPIPLPPGMNPATGSASPRSQFVDATIPGSLLDNVSGMSGLGTNAAPGLSSPGLSTPGTSLASYSGKRVRIASFNLQTLGPTKLAKPHVSETLIRILRQYDVVALQSIQSSRDDILPILTERLNQSGRRYDYLIGPRVGNQESREQFAFVFDTNRIETDRYQLYTIEDPENLVTYDPLVAWFRCKEPPPERAFTFSIVNVHLVTTELNDERQLLPSIIQAVEHDGRQEDDWMIVGEMNGGASELPVDRGVVRFAFTDIPTDVVGERTRAGILFSARGTIEFTGRSGAFDFLRQYNLSLERSLEVSEHLPVWAEFSAVEGGEPGRIAPTDDASQVF